MSKKIFFSFVLLTLSLVVPSSGIFCSITNWELENIKQQSSGALLPMQDYIDDDPIATAAVASASKKPKAPSFFSVFLKNPSSIGSVISSGQALSRKMTHNIGNNFSNKQSEEKILELGVGDGPFTKQMIEQGIKAQQLTLVESQADFCKFLKQKFTGATVIESWAQDLLKGYPDFDHKFDIIISGIPLRNIEDQESRKQLFSTIFQCLKTGGYLRQFTYLFCSPIDSEEIKYVEKLLKCEILVQSEGWTFKNFPPAQVYKYTLRNAAFSCAISSESLGNMREA